MTTILVPAVPVVSLRDSAMVEAIKLADPLNATWEAIARARRLPLRLRPVNVDCAA